jgi:hypothetical protein
VHARICARYADVHVDAADALAPCRDAGVLDEVVVARIGRDLLLLGRADRVCPGGGNAQPVPARDPVGACPQVPQGLGRAGDGIADVRVQLHDGREQLRLQAARQIRTLGFRDQCLDRG